MMKPIKLSVTKNGILVVRIDNNILPIRLIRLEKDRALIITDTMKFYISLAELKNYIIGIRYLPMDVKNKVYHNYPYLIKLAEDLGIV